MNTQKTQKRKDLLINLCFTAWLAAGWLWQPTLFQAAVYFSWILVVMNLLALLTPNWRKVLLAAPEKHPLSRLCALANIGVLAAGGQALLMALIVLAAMLNYAAIAGTETH